jgi:hypothetical protein
VRQEVGDYADRILSALQTLAYAERRLPEEITADMTFGGADVVAVRLTPEAPPGEAPLPLAHRAVAALHNYVVASTVALEVHDLVLPSRRYNWAEAYARRVRLSTHPGSFIMNLALPLAASITEERLDEEPATQEMFELPPQPLGRRVTSRMLGAVQASQQLADDVGAGGRLLSDFAGTNGRAAANATELAALAALGGQDYSVYQLRFAQSPLAPDQIAPVTLRVTPGQQRIMREAADYLRDRQLRSGVTVQGSVVRLYRPGAFGPGEIVIEGHDDESHAMRRWHVELTPADYAAAVEAHRNNFQVLVTGNREERGTHLHLRQLTSFRVIQGLEYEDLAIDKPAVSPRLSFGERELLGGIGMFAPSEGNDAQSVAGSGEDDNPEPSGTER